LPLAAGYEEAIFELKAANWDDNTGVRDCRTIRGDWAWSSGTGGLILGMKWRDHAMVNASNAVEMRVNIA